jgi:hypothetical protein
MRHIVRESRVILGGDSSRRPALNRPALSSPVLFLQAPPPPPSPPPSPPPPLVCTDACPVGSTYAEGDCTCREKLEVVLTFVDLDLVSFNMTAFTAAVLQWLDVPAAQLVNVKITAGSVIVTFDLLPPQGATTFTAASLDVLVTAVRVWYPYTRGVCLRTGQTS